MWSLANSQASTGEGTRLPSPAAAAPMGSALSLETTGMEPSLCFLESKLLTVLSGETTALTAEAPVGFPGRCGSYTADLARAARALSWV